MAKQKISHIIILLGILSFVSCRKEVAVEVHLKNPIDGTGYAGLECSLHEWDNDKFITSVATNSEGFALVEWKSKPLETYKLKFNKSNIIAPQGEYYSTIWPDKQITTKSDGTLTVSGDPIRFSFIPNGNIVKMIKNINCFDENDVMMFRQKNPLESSFSLGSIDFEGCAEILGE